MTTKNLFAYKQFAQSQRRQQVTAVVILSVVMAVATALYTWITWGRWPQDARLTNSKGN
jgi:hypothetical protein